MTTRLAYFLVFLGGSLTVLGVAFIGMYIWWAVISRLGEPDQSLIFWYLPILFIGIIAFIAGIFIFLPSLFKVRKMKKDTLQLTRNDK